MEKVVLIDDNNLEIGAADKDTVHTVNTSLHRGFSLFLFNSKNEILLTQRAAFKKTFPNLWSNTVCGHPAPGETAVVAAHRRLKEELGITIPGIREVAPYRYTFIDINGIMENEICPILIGFSDLEPVPKLVEVADWKRVLWPDFLVNIAEYPDNYTPWVKEEAVILDKILRM